MWVNPAGGLWDEPDNWLGGTVPDEDDSVLIDISEDVTITIANTDVSIKNIETSNTIQLDGSTIRDAAISALEETARLTITANDGTLDGVVRIGTLRARVGRPRSMTVVGAALAGASKARNSSNIPTAACRASALRQLAVKGSGNFTTAQCAGS